MVGLLSCRLVNAFCTFAISVSLLLLLLDVVKNNVNNSCVSNHAPLFFTLYQGRKIVS